MKGYDVRIVSIMDIALFRTMLCLKMITIAVEE